MSARPWNDPRYEKHYNRVMDEARKRGFSEEDLASPYLDKPALRTKSPRITRMISLAYYLGRLRGIRELGQSPHT